jgi:hypothetical protein
MRISFDLDDTIIPGRIVFETESQNIIHALLGLEKIRKDTIKLFRELKNRNHQIGIYTTSFRSKRKIKLTFLFHGFWVDFVINQQQHSRELRHKDIKPSKYPPLFHIDLHIDDSRGVGLEAEKYNFQTIILGERETDWANNILYQIDNLSRNK